MLKFVTPAWYPLPVDDLTNMLSPTDEGLQQIVSESPDVPLLTTSAPVAVLIPDVEDGPTLLEQLAIAQLYESLHGSMQLDDESSFPDDLPPFEVSLVEPIETLAGGTPRPTGGAW